MKKMLAGLMVVMVSGVVSASSFNWYSIPGSVAMPASGGDASSWLVALYADGGDMEMGVDGAGPAIDFDMTGSLGDDTLLTTTINTEGASSLGWFSLVSGVTDNEKIFSVVFNSDSIATATEYVIVDDALATAPAGTDPPLFPGMVDAGGATAGEWQVIPEPSSLALMGLGLAALVARRVRKK